jgi:hypothetical protein
MGTFREYPNAPQNEGLWNHHILGTMLQAIYMDTTVAILRPRCVCQFNFWTIRPMFMQYGTNIMPLNDTFQFPATDNDLAVQEAVTWSVKSCTNFSILQ